MVERKYRVGDLVSVDRQPATMLHFEKGYAIISEVDHNRCQTGTDWQWSYGLIFIVDGVYSEDNYTSQYRHSNLEMIEKGLAHKCKLDDDND